MKKIIMMCTTLLVCFDASALMAQHQLRFSDIDALPLVLTDAQIIEQQRLFGEYPPIKTVHLTLARGQTLARLLAPFQLSGREMHNLSGAMEAYLSAKKMKIGQVFTVKLTDTQIKSVTIKVGFSTQVTLLKQGVQWQVQTTELPTTMTEKAAGGQIDGSLYLAAQKQKIPVDVINRMILAFSHTIDFQREIKRGDHFKLVYRQQNLAQNFDVSKVVQLNYAQLTLSGKIHTLIYFEDDNNSGAFYDEDGQLAQSFLLKTPVDGARLSSFFGPRMHPILGYNRMHKGLDFGVAVGTPVMAAGDAQIDYLGRMGSFGNLVRLKHANGYQTLYAHLKGFAKGLRKGQFVKQHQLIGYVGTTGRSQARHLHYEVHHLGKAINPLSLKQSSQRRLDGEQLASFKRYKQQQLEYLSSIDAG
ncbi:MAG: M23 family metallopeptidase [Algicola sp.]|nr:M23 family metallopeptidase [Algicola sp.]